MSTDFSIKRLIPGFLFYLICAGHSAFAFTCTYSPAGPSNVTITLPSSLTIPASSTVGTTLWSTTTANTQSLGTNCSSNWYPDIGYAPGVSLGATSQANVFATNVQGIGIQVQGYGQAMPAPGSAVNSLGGSNSYSPTGVGSYLSFRLSIIVTGQAGVGTLSLPSLLAGGYASASPTNLAQAYPYGQLMIAGTTRITLSACTTSNVTVPMGSYTRTAFSGGVGGTTPPVSFSISLTCPAGWNGVKYEIDTVTSVVSGTQAVVALNASSTATGVGVQVLDNNGSPLTAAEGFRNAVALGSTPGSAAYNKSAGGSYTIPLKARYYQTSAAIGPGSANSSLTFTMTYN